MDRSIWPENPIVKGTVARVDDVVGRIEEEGCTPELVMWEDGLNVADILACYECVEAGKAGPYHVWQNPCPFDDDGPSLHVADATG